MVTAFSKEKNPSRSLLCDCTTSYFAKVRFKLYCWCWLPSLYFIQEHRPEKILIRLAPANWSQQQINCFKSKTIFNANFTFHMLLLFDMMKISVTERNYNNHPRPLHRESLARSQFLPRKYLPVNILAAVFSHSQRPAAFSEKEIEMNHYIIKIRESRWHTSGHIVVMSWWVSGPPPPTLQPATVDNERRLQSAVGTRLNKIRCHCGTVKIIWFW